MSPSIFSSRHFSAPSLVLAMFLGGTAIPGAAQTIVLGTSSTYAVIASSTVTNTGTTFINGDLGLSPGTAVTGSPIVSGTSHITDAAAATARTDATTAFNQLAGLTVTTTLTGQDLGGMTLTPGVYFFSATAALTGTLTLNGLGQAAPLFVFQIGTTLTTAVNSSIVLSNFANAGNVWFQVGSSATLGSGTSLSGSILSSASNTLVTGATVNGRIFALNGAVALDSSTISLPAAVPEPATTAALFAAVALVCVIIHRKRTAAAPV